MFVPHHLTSVNSFRFNPKEPYPPIVIQPGDETIFLDGSDPTSMFVERVSPTTTVTDGDPVGVWIDKTFIPYGWTVAEFMLTNGISDPLTIPGNHLIAYTDASRPTYRDIGTETYVEFARDSAMQNQTWSGVSLGTLFLDIMWRWTIFTAIQLDNTVDGDEDFVWSLTNDTVLPIPALQTYGNITDGFTVAWTDANGTLVPLVPGRLEQGPHTVTVEHHSDVGMRSSQDGAFDSEIRPWYDRDSFVNGLALGNNTVFGPSSSGGFAGRIYGLFAIRRILTGLEKFVVEAWFDQLPGLGNGLEDTPWHPSALFMSQDRGGVYEPWLYSFKTYNFSPFIEPVDIGDQPNLVLDQSGDFNHLTSVGPSDPFLDYIPVTNFRQLVVNGEFDDLILSPNWVTGVGSASGLVERGALRVTSGGAAGSFAQALSLTPGREYHIHAVGLAVTGSTAVSIAPNLGNFTGEVLLNKISTENIDEFELFSFVATARTMYLHLKVDAGGQCYYDEVRVYDARTGGRAYYLLFEGDNALQSEDSFDMADAYYIGATGEFTSNVDDVTGELIAHGAFDASSEISVGVYCQIQPNEIMDKKFHFRSPGLDLEAAGFRMHRAPHIQSAVRQSLSEVRLRVDGAERVRDTTVTTLPTIQNRPLSVGRHNNTSEWLSGAWYGAVVINKALDDDDAWKCDNWMGGYRSPVPIIDETWHPNIIFDPGGDGTPDVEGGIYDLWDVTSLLKDDNTNPASGEAVNVVLDKRYMGTQDAATWLAANVPGWQSDLSLIPGNHLFAISPTARPIYKTGDRPLEGWLDFDGTNHALETSSGELMSFGPDGAIATGLGTQSLDDFWITHADPAHMGQTRSWVLSSQQGATTEININVGDAYHALDMQPITIHRRNEYFDLTTDRNSATLLYDADFSEWDGFGVSNLALGTIGRYKGVVFHSLVIDRLLTSGERDDLEDWMEGVFALNRLLDRFGNRIVDRAGNPIVNIPRV